MLIMIRYLISLTLGPTWLCASIYICFSRIVTVYSPDLSRLSPRKITVIFIVSDFISLLLQAGGGAIAVVADNLTFEYIGIHLTLAGLALQVFSLGVVLALAGDFARTCMKKTRDWIESYAVIRDSGYFKTFMIGE
jgi:RTA1 like protein